MLIPFSKGKQTLAHHFYINFLSGINHRMIVRHNGVRFDINFADRMQAIFYLTSLYEPETVSTCLQLLHENKKGVYIDVGANIGLITLQVKARRQQTESHLFEPDPAVFSELKRNLALNILDPISYHQKAVSDIPNQTLTFYSSENIFESGWGRLSNQENKNQANGIEVKSVTLDDYIDQNKIETVDVLKIDVEGAEAKVLMGAKNSLKAQKIKHIICELNDPALAAFNSSSADLQKMLSDFGYKEVKKVGMNALFSASASSSK